MKWVLIVLGGIVGLIALMALIGAFVARDHRATSTIALRQPPDRVWTVVRDLGFDVPIIVLESAPPRRLVTRIDPTARSAAHGPTSWRATVPERESA